MRLEGRTALVTGASRGIGAATARALAREGARVVLCARGEGVEAVASDIRSSGGHAIAVRGDLREESFTKELVRRCRTEHGPLDVLVNNAGVIHRARVGMISVDHLRELLDVNVIAMIVLTQYAIRIMDEARDPSIVNVASIAGTSGTEGLAAYAASKGAVVAFTRACAKELATKRVRVNAIAPGMVETDMVTTLPPETYRQQVDSIRMGRIGTPEDVAAAIVYFASPESRYVTGQVLGVDGGMRE